MSATALNGSVRESDTPRVDALDFGDQAIFTKGDGYGQLWALARQLERELRQSGRAWKAAMEERQWWENKAKEYRRLLPRSFEEH